MSERRKRRCPPGVRRPEIFPDASHLRIVLTETPSSRAASPTATIWEFESLWVSSMAGNLPRPRQMCQEPLFLSASYPCQKCPHMGRFGGMSADVISFAVGRIPQWTFAERLRKVRRDAGMNQTEFAEQLGVKRESLTAWETGRNEPRSITEVVERLERLTGVPRQWFLGWLDPEPQPRQVGEEGLEPPTFRVETRHLKIA